MDGSQSTGSEAILDKVRKLMALGSSPSEAEASSALEKARLLLARHGLSLADVVEKDSVTEAPLLEKQRFRTWEVELIGVIARATFTKALRISTDSAKRLLLIGREVNTQSALALFDYLHLVILKLGRAHSGPNVHVESFRRGIVHRLGERLGVYVTPNSASSTSKESPDLPDNNAEERGLVVQMAKASESENTAFIANKYGRTKTSKLGRKVDGASYRYGRVVGEGVSLNRQIGETDFD